MAMDYDLFLVTDMKPRSAMEKLAGGLPGLTWSEDRFFLFDTTASICAIECRDESAVKEAFHFTPTLTVGLRFATNTDYEAFKETMLQATMLLLEHARDAVLLFNGETIVLQRFGGALVFNSGYDIWDDDWLRRRLTVPFELRPVPSPLL